MPRTNDNYAPAEQTEEQRVRDALERYYERRLDEIRRHVPLEESKFTPLERLQELADGAGSGDGTPRPG